MNSLKVTLGTRCFLCAFSGVGQVFIMTQLWHWPLAKVSASGQPNASRCLREKKLEGWVYEWKPPFNIGQTTAYLQLITGKCIEIMRLKPEISTWSCYLYVWKLISTCGCAYRMYLYLFKNKVTVNIKYLLQLKQFFILTVKSSCNLKIIVLDITRPGQNYIISPLGDLLHQDFPAIGRGWFPPVGGPGILPGGPPWGGTPGGGRIPPGGGIALGGGRWKGKAPGGGRAPGGGGIIPGGGGGNIPGGGMWGTGAGVEPAWYAAALVKERTYWLV